LRITNVGRAVSLFAVAMFALLSFVVYLVLPTQGSLLGQAEGALLLSASLGAITGLLHSLTEGHRFLKRASPHAIIYDLRLPAAVIGLALAGGLFYEFRTSSFPLYLIPIPSLLVFSLLSMRGVYPFMGTTKAPTLKRLSEDRLVRFITGKDRLKKLAEYRSQRFSSLLSKSGEIGNPYNIAARSIASSLVAAVVIIPIALVLSILLWLPLVLLAMIPAVLYVYPEVRLKAKASERREGVERELPFFSILVNVLGSAGVSLYSIFNGIVYTKIFVYIRREALLVRRDVMIFGTDPNQSFERLASYHPSRKFSSFLYGYTAKVRSGGDIPTYLLGESGSLLRELEESWARYAGRAGIVGSMMITLFGVIPLMLVVVGVFSPATSMAGLLAFTGVGVPIFTVLLVAMAGRMQPVGEEPLVGNAKRSLLVSLPGLGLGLATGQLWVAATSVLLLFATVYGLSVLDQRRVMREIDDALPEFMKDIMEFRRQEYDLNRSILSIAAHNRYTPSFDKIMSEVATQLKTGTPIDELSVDPKSRLARMVFFVLGQMGHSGGGSVDTVYQLTTYTEKVVEMKRNTRAEMRPYLMLSYISPVLLAFGVSFLGGVLHGLGSAARPGLSSLSAAGLQFGSVPPELIQVSNLLVVVSAAALGLIGAKMTDFTVKNTLRASVSMVVAVGALLVMSSLNFASLFHIGI
jgi:archaeal flagellar protein FlaJ